MTDHDQRSCGCTACLKLRSELEAELKKAEHMARFLEVLDRALAAAGKRRIKEERAN